MSYDNRGSHLPGVVAGADLSTHQHKIVKLDGSGKVILCGAGEYPAGVLEDSPVADSGANVMGPGSVAKVVVGVGGLTPGQLVASDAAGLAVVAGAGDWVLGQSLGTYNAGELASIWLGATGVAP